jgi:predicted phosphoadenosine phosphosulfate sulfurtransferase
MAVKRIEGTMDCVTAARQRILNTFSNGVPVYLSFSAGKDSLCLAYLVYAMIKAGKIDAKQLVVIFIDEEAIYDSMYQMAVRWRKRFLSVGSEFRWYCLPVKQSSILHYLQSTESWITWEPGKEDSWVRQLPPFAITRSPYLNYPGEMNYQEFCQTITKDGIQIVGLRGSESLQRAKLLAGIALGKGAITGSNCQYPIYDWRDSDVWLFIKEHNLDFPDAYIHLYQVGVSKRHLRLCNFFGSEGIAGLRYIAETDPELWNHIEKRAADAYLTLLYWDSEMFKRNTRKRRALEGDAPVKDYKAECKKMLFTEADKYFSIASMKKVHAAYRTFYIRNSSVMTNDNFRAMHDAIIAGDPKLRSLRALYTTVYKQYADFSRETSPQKGGEKT